MSLRPRECLTQRPNLGRFASRSDHELHSPTRLGSKCPKAATDDYFLTAQMIYEFIIRVPSLFSPDDMDQIRWSAWPGISGGFHRNTEREITRLHFFNETKKCYSYPQLRMTEIAYENRHLLLLPLFLQVLFISSFQVWSFAFLPAAFLLIALLLEVFPHTIPYSFLPSS